MARLSTKIVLDKSGNSYRCGETISGTVEVFIHEECRNGTLILAMGCRGTGQAPGLKMNYLTDKEWWTLFTGEWKAGTGKYPFSVTAPDGYSYTGTIMTACWYLRAGFVGEGGTVVRQNWQDADLEGEDRLDLSLAPGQVTPEDRKRSSASQIVRKESTGSMRGCMIPSLLLFLGGAAAAWWGWEKDLFLPGFVAALAGLAVTGLAVRQSLIERKVAMVEFRIGATVVWPGERVPCSVTVKAKAPVEIEQAALTLEGWEHVKKFTGMHRTTGPVNKHVVHKEVREMHLPVRSLPAGASVELRGEYTVPANAPGTMDFDNEVKFLWRLEIRIKITGSPDWFDVQPISVLPRLPAPSAGDRGIGG